MMTLPAPLSNFMQGQKLDGLKPFALLYRNKWDSVNNKYTLEQTPLDISDLIAKPNTLSMTLDVNEVAQYNANNVTLTLSDTKNYFVEGTPNSYFPEGYQIYGSRIVLYYGLDGVNRTPLFTGVIKELPTHKPEKYQVDVKLVSPLEMLKDIEAKDFSDKVTGETLTYKSTDSDGHRIYWTTGTGVGGFDAVYANGAKLFEGVDYEIGQLNEFGKPAILTIINSTHYFSAITADYYVWKTNLTVEKIVEGLAGVAGYDSGTEDIRQVVWNTEVRTAMYTDLIASLGYKKEGNDYNFVGNQEFFNTSFRGFGPKYYSYSYLPKNFNISFSANSPYNGSGEMYYELGKFSTPATEYSTGLVTGIRFLLYRNYNYNHIAVYQLVNGAGSSTTVLSEIHSSADVSINLRVRGNVAYLSGSTASVTYTFPTSFDWGINDTYNQCKQPSSNTHTLTNFSLTILDENENIINTLNTRGVIVQAGDGNARGFEGIRAVFSSEDTQYTLSYRVQNNNSWGNWKLSTFGSTIGEEGNYLQSVLNVTSQFPTITALSVFYLGSVLNLQLVNLSGKTVLEALQDFALISGYEFGVDRQGVFFFRPRVSSTTPVYVLDHSELVKVDSVKKNLSDFFTKLTLTFAQVPLEFYANTGARPTPIDKYGVINKEIDKPDIVNYDNPELAQAIGPQLLEVYSALPNVIQATGKLNLALELGDIVSLRRNMNLITPEEYTDYSKYKDLNTYYRACKITGMNYNFSKKQITYTLRDVSNKDTEPMYELEQFVYELPIKLGVKK